MRSPTDETSTQKKTRQPKQHRFSAWLDEQQVKRTVRRWHRQQKHQARKGPGERTAEKRCPTPASSAMRCIWWASGPSMQASGAGRGILKVAVAVLSHVGSLLFTIFRPIGIGLVVFLEDLLQPFVRLYSGIRHIRSCRNSTRRRAGGRSAPRRWNTSRAASGGICRWCGMHSLMCCRWQGWLRWLWWCGCSSARLTVWRCASTGRRWAMWPASR